MQTCLQRVREEDTCNVCENDVPSETSQTSWTLSWQIASRHDMKVNVFRLQERIAPTQTRLGRWHSWWPPTDLENSAKTMFKHQVNQRNTKWSLSVRLSRGPSFTVERRNFNNAFDWSILEGNSYGGRRDDYVCGSENDVNMFVVTRRVLQHLIVFTER